MNEGKLWGDRFAFDPDWKPDWDESRENFSELVGKTVTGISLDADRERLLFRCAGCMTLVMWHEQDCCESVTLDDIAGDMDDLIGAEIKQAEESMSAEEHDDGSATWTFYKIRTIKGDVTLRWYGQSNGYYSESVSTVWTS